jgi:hypothetical protein
MHDELARRFTELDRNFQSGNTTTVLFSIMVTLSVSKHCLVKTASEFIHVRFMLIARNFANEANGTSLSEAPI